ncbi:MAG: NAD(P)-dependent alcohol dehydrogenase [Steroidobacteraceae bacterium]|nr:NAD(P)-dependent alcohol dehydrogenase [Steroidobacteraceae bacterium]
MRAWTYHCYGGPEVLGLESVAKPTPAADEILVEIRAAAVNPLDWHYLRGEPYIMRMGAGIGTPTDPRMGVDFSGVVQTVGRDVTKFKPGDEVFGASGGAFGDYVVLRESRNIVLKPANISFEQAAAVPIAAITALQALRDTGQVKAGSKVLINGASGGVGTFAVQIAKALGAEVTGVCSGRNVELVKSLGADRVIDYTQTDFTEGAEKYDVIIDNIGNQPLSKLRRVMTAEGKDVIVGAPSDGKWLGPLSVPLKGQMYSWFVKQEFLFFLAEVNPEDLEYLSGLMREGKLKPVIDKTYPFSELPDAIRYVETGRARGKVVIGK